LKNYNKLFEKIKVKSAEMKNRLVMAPMATRFASFNGEVTERLIRYYEERAKGGVGLITIEASAISREGIGWENNLSIYDDHYVKGLQKLTDTLHQYGTKVSLEIFHTGSKAPAAIIGQLPVAPSSLNQGGSVPRELDVEEIKVLVKKFGDAARRAKEAGFDIVNIHMAHGYLINQFLSPLTNKRNDAYGGSTEKRATFALEVIAEVRKQVGDDFPVFCRLTAEEGVGSIGIDVHESVKIAAILEKAGVDAIDISGGSSLKPYLTEGTYSLKPGFLVYLAEAIKKAVDIPITIVGKIRKPEFAEEILQKGIADFIVLGRPFITDPYWPEKVKNHREAEIVPCISCVQGCTGRLGKDLEISCTVNPGVGREGMFKSPCTAKKVLVAGGGISGMYLANELAKQGNQVTLLEKEAHLGGQINLAVVPHHKSNDLVPLLDYLKHQLDLNGVQVRLNEAATVKSVQKYSPDMIIQATGAEPKVCKIPGTEGMDVLSAWEVLKDKACPGKNIAVIGGGEVGLETAEFLTNDLKKNVTVFEILPEYGKDMNRHERQFLLQRLEKSNIEIFTQAKVLGMKGKNLHFKRGDLDELTGPIDTLVLAIGSQSQRSQLCQDLDIPVYPAGDCIVPGRMFEAFHSAEMLKYEI